jgi:ribosomal protein S18 acetylase RimI-like enzyme
VTLRSSLRARQRIRGVPVVLSTPVADPRTVCVQLRSDDAVPGDFFAAMRTEMEARGFRRVRSNAIAERFVDDARHAGFEVAQRLALLRRHGADAVSSADSTSSAGGDHHVDAFTYRGPTSRSRLTLEQCARVDALSFAPSWSLDAVGLRDAAGATPRHRFFVSRLADTVTGFLLCGADVRHGFIQRLAVDPRVRNNGVAKSLLNASLRWLASTTIETTWVNTEPTNEAALRLYAGAGFHRHHDGLVVVEWSA